MLITVNESSPMVLFESIKKGDLFCDRHNRVYIKIGQEYAIRIGADIEVHRDFVDQSVKRVKNLAVTV